MFILSCRFSKVLSSVVVAFWRAFTCYGRNVLVSMVTWPLVALKSNTKPAKSLHVPLTGAFFATLDAWLSPPKRAWKVCHNVVASILVVPFLAMQKCHVFSIVLASTAFISTVVLVTVARVLVTWPRYGNWKCRPKREARKIKTRRRRRRSM